MNDYLWTSDLTVQCLRVCADDIDVVAAAQISTKGDAVLEAFQDKDGTPMTAEKFTGLVNFLMANRHGCYDDQTEVLTDAGWKFWPEIDGTEQFVTLNLFTDDIQYQSASRLIQKPSDGTMIEMKMAQVDVLVTPDHNMLAATRTHYGWDYNLVKASSFLDRAHRIRMGGGTWSGDLHCPEVAALIGFIAADGHVGSSSIQFNLRRQRKIDFLYSLGFDISTTDGQRFGVINLTEDIKLWAKETYTETKDRCFPRELLMRGDEETLSALLDGYLVGDGHISATGKITASSVSQTLINDLQELALKIGMAATQTSTLIRNNNAYGERPLHRITVYRNRNIEPRLGWTQEARENQIRVVPYSGMVYCVTVPNGTLYVRRNGKPMWSGNSPFEHNMFRFFVKAPIKVFREFHRHRVGFSYNEESGRYTELKPEFYIPPAHRPLVQVGKPGHYTFVEGTFEQYSAQKDRVKKSNALAYDMYLEAMADGIAKEVARDVLPVNLYSSMWVTCNARSIMSFLSLRTTKTGVEDMWGDAFDFDIPDPLFPSYPMWEIEQVGLQMEKAFADAMPLTHKAFRIHRSVSP